MQKLRERKQHQEEISADRIAKHHERCNEILRLVQLPAYSYAKQLGAQLCEQYRCEPPKTDAERQRWETYNTLLWAYRQLFDEIETLAKNAPDRG